VAIVVGYKLVITDENTALKGNPERIKSSAKQLEFTALPSGSISSQTL
jgi:hypothetical protein